METDSITTTENKVIETVRTDIHILTPNIFGMIELEKNISQIKE